MKTYNRLVRKAGKIMYTLSAAFLIAAMLVNVIPPTPAYAHHPELSGVVTCAVDGTQKVTWTINNWSGTTLPMKITAINRSVGVAVNTMVPVSVEGVEYLPGAQTGTITLSVSGYWTNGATGTTSASVSLPGSCKSPDYKLNLSHMYCYDGDSEDLDGMVEIHFVLLNVPDGITPGTLTYTYGTIIPGAHTGNTWHYTDFKPSGTYDVQSASVVVGGVTVTLHNPGDYADTFTCVEPPVEGCTDITADNYNPLATVDDGSCTYKVPGCTDITADNFNPLANLEDGSCTYTVPGCTDQTADNFNPSANLDDGSCTYTVPGCTDQSADNFNLSANLDDGSCTYTVPGCTDITADNFNPSANLDDGSCTYTVPGCIDQSADNYNPSANLDDGSCTYTVPGCTDQTADNFNPLANSDDGSCTYTVPGCTDQTAENFNSKATVDDGSCTYTPTYSICWNGTPYNNLVEADLVNYPGYSVGNCPGISIDPVDVTRVCTAFTFENLNPIKINGNWMIDGTDLSGFFSLDPFESITINTGYHPGDLKINSGDFAFNVAVPTNCDSSSVLIPVTGVDTGSFGGFGSRNLFFASIAFLGLGLVLSGVSRKLEE